MRLAAVRLRLSLLVLLVLVPLPLLPGLAPTMSAARTGGAAAGAAQPVATATPVPQTWTGGGSSNNWTDPGNWASGTVPSSGQVLFFPPGVAKKAMTNDFPDGTAFELVFQDSGYTLNGNRLAVQHFTASGAGVVAINTPITLPFSQTTFGVTSGGRVQLTGPLSGPGGLTLVGGGTLVLAGSAPNTYTGLTSVARGTLTLATPAGVPAVSSQVSIGLNSGAPNSAVLSVTATNQLPPDAVVTTDVTGSFGIGGAGSAVDERITGLQLLGGNVLVSNTLPSTTTLQVTGDVSKLPSAADAFMPGLLGGQLSLPAGPHTFDIAGTGGSTAADLAIYLPIVGAGNLTKTGPGTLLLGGTNTYTGPTTLNAGTVWLYGSLGSPVSVNNGASLDGGAGGALNGPTTINTGGGFSLGIGTTVFGPTTAAGGISFASGSTLTEPINGSQPVDGSGNAYGQLKAAGGQVLLNGATLTVPVASSYTPPVGTAFTVIQNSTGLPVVGTFANQPEGSTVLGSGGTSFRLTYHGNSGNDVVLTSLGQVAATPTPTATPTATRTPTATATPTPVGLGNLRFVQPVRVVDTRNGSGGPIGFQAAAGCQPIAAGQLLNNTTTRFKLAGCTFGSTSVPADATGVLVNVTLVQAFAAGGFLTIYPGDAPSPPNASTVNPSTSTAANFWATGLAPVGAGTNAGTLAVFSAGDPRDVIIDLVGYYSPSNPNTVGNLKFVSPVRVLDTRPAPNGPIGFQPGGCTTIAAGPITPNTITRYQLGGCTVGTTSFPADTAGVLAHITTVQGGPSGGFTTLLPGDASGTPNTSTVNPNTGIDFNAWAVGLPTGGATSGQFGVYSTNSQHVIVDIVGYFAPSNPSTVGNLSFVTPARVLDTRPPGFGPIGFQPNGSPIMAGQLASGSTTRYLLNGQSFAGGSLTVPGDVKGVLINVTLSQAAAAGGFVTAFPGSDPAAPNTSTVNPNTAIAASFWANGIGLPPLTNPGTLGIFSTGDPRDVIVDLVGYFR